MHHLGSSTRRRGAESPPTAVCAFVLLTTVTLLISYRYTCDHRAFLQQVSPLQMEGSARSEESGSLIVV